MSSVWPPTPDYDASDFDDPVVDKPAAGLPELHTTVESVIAIINARNAPGGLCGLRDDGTLDPAQLPTTGAPYQLASGFLAAMENLIAAANRFVYFDAAGDAQLGTLNAAIVALLAAADLQAFRAAAGLEIGTDVQAWSGELDQVTTAGEVAQTAGFDEVGNPAPLVGYFMRNAAGGVQIVPPASVDMTAVNTAIADALNAYAAARNLDDMLTATEAAWLYVPASLFSDAGIELIAAADAAAARLVLGFDNAAPGATGLALLATATEEAARLALKTQGDTNARFDLDFLVTTYSPLAGGAVGTGGNAASSAGETGHPGCLDLRSGTASGAGYKVYGYNKALILRGGETLRGILKFPNTFTTITHIFGFSSNGSIVEPADGAYFWLSGDGVLTPKTANGSTRTSGSTLTLSTATWYTLQITVNADATAVLFEVLDDAETVLLTQNITTNIPTTATHEVGPIIAATSTDTSGTLVLATVDRFSGYLLRG